MARPTKLTEQVRQDLSQMLTSGADAETAARAAGISPRSLRRWIARAEELRVREEDGKRIRAEDRLYLDLLNDVEVAIATLEVRSLANIQRAATNGTWQASAWLLERMFPERYAGQRRPPGRPPGATSAPDRPSTAGDPPPRVRLKAVK